MYEKILVEQNKHWKKESLELGIQREKLEDILPYINKKQIIVITGIRRCGKSYILRQIIAFLLKEKINEKNILFLNLENPYFEEARKNATSLDKIFEEYLNLTEPTEKTYLLLDETQFFENWQIFVKAKYEQEKIKFILTGSNAWLLSSEYVSLLSGRTIHLELFPFSFMEFLSAKRIEATSKIERASNERKIKKAYQEYAQWGGFPEIILTEQEEQKREIIVNYYNNIIYRDIIPRFKITNIRQTQELAHYLISNPSKLISYTKLSKIINLSDKTIKEYITYFSQAYLLFELNKYSHSLKKQIGNPKKIFAADVGFITSLGFSSTNDSGRILENIVCIELKRNKKEIYYHQEKKECDFVIREGRKITQAIQVCQMLTEENRKRELSGLYDAMESYDLKEGLIITEEQEEKIKEGKYTIHIKPIWKWLLEKK